MMPHKLTSCAVIGQTTQLQTFHGQASLDYRANHGVALPNLQKKVPSLQQEAREPSEMSLWVAIFPQAALWTPLYLKLFSGCSIKNMSNTRLCFLKLALFELKCNC